MTSRLRSTRKTVFRPLPDLLRGINPLVILAEIDFPMVLYRIFLCFVVNLHLDL